MLAAPPAPVGRGRRASAELSEELSLEPHAASTNVPAAVTAIRAVRKLRREFTVKITPSKD